MTDSEKSINSREVTIFRNRSFLQKAQSADVKEYMAMSKESIGSYFESQYSGRIGSGLSLSEEKLLMPEIVDVPGDDRDFRKKVSEFFADITTHVPWENGITLEIGLEKDNTGTLSLDNMPIKIIDYVKWRHARKHPQVALSKALAEGNQMIKFYIFDKNDIQQQTTRKGKDRDTAMKIYLQVKEDGDKVDTMLTLLGIDIREYYGQKESTELKIEKLRDLVSEKPDVFVREYNAGDIEIRGTIKQMVDTKILLQVGNKFIDAESKDPLANSIDEMIMVFKDDEHTQVVTMLQARKQEAMNKPIAKGKKKTVAKV